MVSAIAHLNTKPHSQPRPLENDTPLQSRSLIRGGLSRLSILVARSRTKCQPLYQLPRFHSVKIAAIGSKLKLRDVSLDDDVTDRG